MYRHPYVDEEGFVDELFLGLELDPEPDVFVGLGLAQEGRVSPDEAEALLLFDLFEVDLPVFDDNLETRLFPADFEELALLGLLQHVVPQTDGAAALERPPDLLLHSDALAPVEIDVAVELGVLGRLLHEEGIESVEDNVDLVELAPLLVLQGGDEALDEGSDKQSRGVVVLDDILDYPFAVLHEWQAHQVVDDVGYQIFVGVQLVDAGGHCYFEFLPHLVPKRVLGSPLHLLETLVGASTVGHASLPY
jgi:hypothetical protein